MVNITDIRLETNTIINIHSNRTVIYLMWENFGGGDIGEREHFKGKTLANELHV